MKAILTYTGLRVLDLDRSVVFYTRLLGMREVSRSEIAATGGTVVGLVSAEGGHPLELNYYPPGSKYALPYEPGEGLDHLGFQVEDLGHALTEVTTAGHPTILEMRTSSSR